MNLWRGRNGFRLQRYAKGDRLVWCGLPGKPNETRSQITATNSFAQLAKALEYVGTAEVSGFTPAEELAFA
jgi:hypothetical protein